VSTTIGALHVRRSILIDALPGQVWEEFTSFEKIHAWLGHGHELHSFEYALGGEVRFSVQIDGEQRFFGGPVCVLDEAKELTFENQWESLHEASVPTFWTFRLTPIYGRTLVELFHHGFERLGSAGADNLEGYEQGWTVHHLVRLRKIVEG